MPNYAYHPRDPRYWEEDEPETPPAAEQTPVEEAAAATPPPVTTAPPAAATPPPATTAALTGGFNPADWPDPYESSATQYNTAINAANPGGEDPNKSFYQGTDPGGGYLAGVGQTLAPGRSVTAADAQRFIEEARAAGADDAYIRDFLARNPYDFSRLKNAYLDEYVGQMGDSNDPATAGQMLYPYSAANTPEKGGPTSQYTGGGGGGTPYDDGGLTSIPPEGIYIDGNLAMPDQPLGGEGALQALLTYLQGERGTSTKENDDLRAILMKQLDALDNPVSLEDPGIREAVAANRNALQRGTEQQRREVAERRAYDESGGVGSQGYQTDVDRLLQQQGESGAEFEGSVLYQEMTQRRGQLNNLLTQAMALGDANTARTIQAELAAIDQQLGQSRFYDTQALNYAQMEQQANQYLMSLLYGGNLNV